MGLEQAENNFCHIIVMIKATPKNSIMLKEIVYCL
jgi:hypothetical protein